MIFAPHWRLGARVDHLPSHTSREVGMAQITDTSNNEYGQAKIKHRPLHGDKNECTVQLFPEFIKPQMPCPDHGPGQFSTKYSFFTSYLKFGRWPFYTGQNKNKTLIEE